MNLDKLLLYFTEVMEDIFLHVGSVEDLLNDKQQMRLIASIFNALDRLGLTIDEVLPNLISDSYYEGIKEASTALSEIVAAVSETSVTVAAAEMAEVITGVLEAEPTKVQKRVHLEALSEIADDSLLDLRAAIRTAKDSASSAINKTLSEVRSSMAKNLITGDPRKVAAAEVAKAFREGGLTSFITKDGKRLPLDFYAKTVVNTKIRHANVTGATNRYTEAGVTLVQIHENSDTCPICSKYRDLVVSTTGKHEGYQSAKQVKLPPYHPNCRGTTRPFVEEFKTDDEIRVEKNKSKAFKPDKDTRTPAQKRAYEMEQTIRRKVNAEKKQFARWSAALGKDNFKTIGAFRRAKRSNSVKFKELQAEYNRIMREDVL